MLRLLFPGGLFLLVGLCTDVPPDAPPVASSEHGLAGGLATSLASGAECVSLADAAPLPDVLHESSGVAASRRHAGVYWSHNDRGGEARVFAVDSAGGLLGTVEVRGAEARDWEDLSLASCPAGDCLYIADTGDNTGKRDRVTVYRVPEPGPGAKATAPAEAFPARYPEGPQDTEALFVLPGERVFLVTKGEHGPVRVYRYPEPLRPEREVELDLVGELAEKADRRGAKVTAADASPDGERVAIRTYEALFLYAAAELLQEEAPEPLSVLDLEPLEEAQGEAVAFGAGREMVLTSEAGDRERAELTRVRCPGPRAEAG